MAIDQSQLEIKITFDSADASKELNKFLSAIEQSGQKITGTFQQTSQALSDITKNTSKFHQGAASSFSRFGKTIEGAFIPLTGLNQAIQLSQQAMNALSSAFNATAGSAIKLSLSVAQINTLLTEQEKQTFNAQKAILDLQYALGGDQQDIAKAYYEVISSGAVSAADSQKLLTQAMKLATGGVTSLASASNVLTSVIAAYGKTANDAASISDTLFIAARDGKTDIASLSSEIGNALGIAAQLGVSFEELSAAISAVTLAGVSTSEAVTSVNSVMVGLSKQTKDMSDVLKDLGITSIQTAIKQEGLAGVIRKLVASSGGSSEAITNMMGRIEALKATTAIASKDIGTKFDQIYKNILTSSQKTGDATAYAFQQITESSSYQLNLLKSRTQSILTEIGIGASDAMGKLAKVVNAGITNIIGYVGQLKSGIDAVNLSQSFKDISASVEILTASIITLTAAFSIATFGSIAGIATKISTGFIAIANAVKLASAALLPFLALGTKIFTIVTAVTTLVAAFDFLARNIEAIVESAGLAFEYLQNKVSDAIEFIKAKVQGLDAVPQAVQVKSGKTADNIEERFMKLVANLDMGLAGAISDVAEKFMSGFTEQLPTVEQAANSTAKAIASIPAIKAPDEETIRRYDSIKNSIKNIQEEVDRLGATEEQAARIIAARQLEEIKNVRDLLEAEHRLTSERAKNLATAALLTQTKLNKQLVEIEKKRASEYLDAQTDIAKAQGNQVKVIELSYKKQENSFKELYDKQLITASEYHDAIVGLNKKQAEEINSINKQYGDSTLNATAKALDALKGGVNGLRDGLLGFWQSNREAAIKAQEATGKMGKDAALNAMANVNLIVMIIKSVIDIFGQSEEEAKKFFQGIIDKALELPVLISKNVANLVAIIIQNIPKAILASIPVIIESLGGTAIRIIGVLIQEIPKLFKTIFSKKFWASIVNGLWQAIKDVFSGKQTKEQIKASTKAQASKAIGGASDQLFAVREKGANGFKDAGNAISKAFKEGSETARSIFTQIWEGIKAVFQYIYDKLLKPWVEIVQGAFDVILTVWKTAIEGLINTFKLVWNLAKTIFSAIIDAFTALWDIVKIMFSGIIDAFAILWDAVKIIFQTIIDAFSSAFLLIKETIFDPIVEAFSVLWNFVKDGIFGPIIDAFKALWDFVTTLFDDPIAAFQGLWEDIKNIFSDIVDAFGNLFSSVKDIFTNVIDGLGKWASDFMEKVSSVFGKIKDLFVEAFDKVKEKLGKLIETIGTAFTKLGDKLKAIVDYIKEFGAKMWDGFKEAVGKAGTFFADLGGKIWEGMKGVGSMFSDWGAKIWEGFKGVASGFKEWGQDIWEGFKDSLGKLAKAVKDAVVKAVKSIFDANGGVVPKHLAVGGPVYAQTGKWMQPQGTDRIPAMLTPGEFVLSKPAVDRVGVPSLKALNRGQAGLGGAITQNVSINIQTEQPIDDWFIKNKLVPEIEKSLKRSSLDGKRVIAPTGVR